MSTLLFPNAIFPSGNFASLVCYGVGLQTILVGSIEKERPSGRTISICADTLDVEEISAQRAEIDEASGHVTLNFPTGKIGSWEKWNRRRLFMYHDNTKDNAKIMQSFDTRAIFGKKNQNGLFWPF